MRLYIQFCSFFKVLFYFPSRYLSSIELMPVFSLRWSLPSALGCQKVRFLALSTSLTVIVGIFVSSFSSVTNILKFFTRFKKVCLHRGRCTDHNSIEHQDHRSGRRSTTTNERSKHFLLVYQRIAICILFLLFILISWLF